MKKYLFYLTFGPIQSFIAKSRKTRDLYAASQILSHIAKNAVKAVKQQGGALIIPQQDLNSDSLPNYLLAEFYKEPKSEAIERDVREKFKEIAEKTRKRTVVQKPADFDQQIAEHLEVHWAFVEWQEDYATTYKNLQSIVAGLKNTRHFCQIKNGAGEVGRKCSLDGERNALFYHKDYNNKVPLYLSNAAVEIKTSKIRPNEGLSAISLVKRYYHTPEFPSTAGIALMHWCEEVQKFPEGKAALGKIKESFDEQDWDEQLLLKENHTAKYFDKNGLDRDKLPFLQKQVEILDSFHLKQTRYYALLKYDGDKMGEHLSGGSLPEEEKDLRSFQEKLSKQLATFAKHAKEKILIPPHGKTVYAGGDDFLGFVTLQSIFSIAEQLRVEFDEQVNEPIKNEFKLTKSLTFSAGIVIAHYKMPLHIVLHNVHDLLDKVAKEKLNRDAFAIRLLKHSGESHECGFKWKLGEKDTPLKDLQYITEQLKENFSTTFIQRLNEEMRLLRQETVDTKIIECEIKRLVKRSAQKEKLDKEKEYLIASLNRINKKATKNFLEALNVCKFMHRETE